ncbi:unnamed protein product [Colias eurytheme]|nr:unnamed protein product [Colias eurytheme]CAG4981950.1 unnamed protein product [Colias eurytheme]
MKCSIVGCGLCQSKNRPNLTFQRLPIFAKADHPSQFALIDISNTTDQPSCSGYSHPQDAKDLELASALEE